MTLERKILFGIPDIRTISYACNKCGARATFPLGQYAKDPTNACYVCQHPWRAGNRQLSPFPAENSAYVALLEALHEVKKLEKEVGFKMLFELEEPSLVREGA
jgi:hypothetical protein